MPARRQADRPESGSDPRLVELEVLAGLPNETDRLDDARTAYDYYELRNRQYIPRRDAENELDYLTRPKRVLPFTRRVVQVLAQHLYGTGPARQVKGDADATRWLEGVYADNLANAMWQRADRLSTLGGAGAFQVVATGDPRRPLKLQLWWPHEFAVFGADPMAPDAVCTMEMVDCQKVYTLWFADRYRVYRSKKWNGETAGAVQPVPDGPWMPNPYGGLPFAFAHAELPVTSFWEGQLGDYLVHANAAADDALSDLAHGIKRYLYPLGVAENCDIGFEPINKMGAFVRLTSMLKELEGVPPARLSYLQAELDIIGAWTDIENGLMHSLDNLGIPRSAWRMETAQVASGIAILAEQLPLLDRARERREPFRLYETDLARCCLRSAGSYYPGLARYRELAGDLELILTWPEPTIPLPGPDRNDDDDWSIAHGIKSRVMVAMERYGLTRDQAIARLKQVAADEADATQILPPPTSPIGPQGGPDAGPGADAGEAPSSAQDVPDQDPNDLVVTADDE